MKTKEKIIEEILSGQSTVKFILDSFENDSKVRLYQTEKLTGTQFIEQLSSTDP